MIRRYVIPMLIGLGLLTACHAQDKSTEMTEHEFTNELINESSPYLLQHAHNPVNWHPWNDESLEIAKNENKLLLISIGYAACHWCHVMEHESFEDSTIAAIMNNNFINIKVDREERPDVDQIYMDACQLITGGGGWPLNAIALPDGRPIYAGTYFPKKEWVKILEYFANYYPANIGDAEKRADQILAGINSIETVDLVMNDEDFTAEDLSTVFNNWQSKIDYKWGGRQGSPKFPMPTTINFLCEYAFYSNEQKAIDAAKITLDGIATGGIYDHIGGGFARYSVDEEWHVPHFEKMLYDNAQLLSVYSKAYQRTKNTLYKERVYETYAWLELEMKDGQGGYFSSLDADSEGEEGKFYVMSYEELSDLLGEEMEVFADYYDVSKKGNWEHTNVLRTIRSKEELTQKHNLSEIEFENSINKSKEKVFKYRSKRIRPGLDDKVLTSWNALLVKGLVDAYLAFKDERFLISASEIVSFIEEHQLGNDGRLNRNFKNGKSTINGFLDDYAALIQAYIALYDAGLGKSNLEKAKRLYEYCKKHFYDESDQMFFYTSNLDNPLVTRKKELSDNVIPSSNSIMANNIYLLGKYYANNNYLDVAKQMLNNMLQNTKEHGPFYSNWASLLGHFVHEPYEIVIIGNDFKAKRLAFAQHYLPNAIFLPAKKEGKLALMEAKLVKGETMIYVCQQKTCKMPTTEVEEAILLMN